MQFFHATHALIGLFCKSVFPLLTTETKGSTSVAVSTNCYTFSKRNEISQKSTLSQLIKQGNKQLNKMCLWSQNTRLQYVSSFSNGSVNSWEHKLFTFYFKIAVLQSKQHPQNSTCWWERFSRRSKGGWWIYSWLHFRDDLLSQLLQSS